MECEYCKMDVCLLDDIVKIIGVSDIKNKEQVLTLIEKYADSIVKNTQEEAADCALNLVSLLSLTGGKDSDIKAIRSAAGVVRFSEIDRTEWEGE